jgi:hypothetical protein
MRMFIGRVNGVDEWMAEHEEAEFGRRYEKGGPSLGAFKPLHVTNLKDREDEDHHINFLLQFQRA